MFVVLQTLLIHQALQICEGGGGQSQRQECFQPKSSEVFVHECCRKYFVPIVCVTSFPVEVKKILTGHE